MNRICVVLPYFGELPSTWSLTYWSMTVNQGVDWLIVTDQVDKVRAASNIRVVGATLADLRRRFEESLGIPVALPDPYKLCDFKPAYGLLFEDYLTEYTHWGYCDADAVFGRLTRWFDEGLGAQAEKVFLRGHLSISQNSPQMRELFLAPTPGVQPFARVAASDEVQLFDEVGGYYQVLRHHNIRVFDSTEIMDIWPWTYRLRATSAPRTANVRRAYVIQHQKVLEVDRNSEQILREGPYIHLQKRRYPSSAIGSEGSIPYRPPRDGEVIVIGPTSIGYAPTLHDALALLARMEREPSAFLTWSRSAAQRRWRNLSAKLRRRLADS